MYNQTKVGSNADIVVSIFARIIVIFLFCQIQAKHTYKGNLLSTLNREADRLPEHHM